MATRERVGLAADTWVDVLEADRLRVQGSYDEALTLCDGTCYPGSRTNGCWQRVTLTATAPPPSSRRSPAPPSEQATPAARSS